MLRAQRASLRIAFQPCSAEVVRCRWASRGHRGGHSPQSRSRKDHGGPQRRKPPTILSKVPLPETQDSQPSKKPSLIEQLFPEEARRHEEQQKARREVPPLPILIDEQVAISQAKPDANPKRAEASRIHVLAKEQRSAARRQLQADIEASQPGVAVLVLRNASKNLTEDDFRRLVPQGRHIEGWTLQQGDIMKVVPGRDLDTLEQNNTYYILFNSALNAYTFQGHVSKIHKLAAAHQPTSTASPLPPPPGYMIEGLDVHTAIQAYALVPPSQKLELRQLKPPLTPVMQSMVANGGFKPIIDRENKMPYEARLTMEGPQLQLSIVRHIFLETGRLRALSWSGSPEVDFKISRWEPKALPLATDRSGYAVHLADGANIATPEGQSAVRAQKQRAPGVVYIVGFDNEAAAQTFVTHWHHRRLESPGTAPRFEDEGELPPIARVEILW